MFLLPCWQTLAQSSAQLTLCLPGPQRGIAFADGRPRVFDVLPGLQKGSTFDLPVRPPERFCPRRRPPEAPRRTVRPPEGLHFRRRPPVSLRRWSPESSRRPVRPPEGFHLHRWPPEGSRLRCRPPESLRGPVCPPECLRRPAKLPAGFRPPDHVPSWDVGSQALCPQFPGSHFLAPYDS
ncbi:histone-lysine N-methyltransferase 2D-like [Perca flavescens]|uniref:histone-lysine N-methyltransferase 2D-like n=1 Tax=Perca flavescens TaxID=8167 RepID=UPI00106E045F|nr:histone-lysine N-methyltransferase 2D-like [Perca flavescens]